MARPTGRPSERPCYTPAQLHQVYEHIGLPSKFRYEPGEFSREVIRHRDGFNFLTALQTYTLATVPFENLELHYSSHHQVSIHADALFNKIIRQGNGRGGYCVENNTFLGTVLRSLGFEVMSVGARVNSQVTPGGELSGECRFGGWSHMVNLITIRGEIYMVDVGFGSGGPTHPMSLSSDGGITMNMPPNQNVRLRRDGIPENEHIDTKLWLLERRNADDGPWTPLYCFEDQYCFLPQDFEVMNFFTSTHRTCYFTFRVLASRYVLEEGSDRLIGDVVLYENSVHRRVGGTKELLATLTTEQERIEALKYFLGITLSESQREGIRGMCTELNP
ncbi:hypothetical protein LTR36_004026 [Oleoguttula mirabilis]|uniref:Arylamine N-acetyltransferase n=1 Tax=Oleoguttula mirabilis TaxID=1507867 RepID=A0AAV9JHV9_9PEZI|nr:hypothetical protein LTR36_004026 [Oleoguttula mirabilis]